jgi:transposase
MPAETYSVEFFEKILSLESPWTVQGVTLSDDRSRVDLKIGVGMKLKAKCPKCGEVCGIHDRVRRSWRHLDVCNAECYINAEIPRTKCEGCGVLQMSIPWAREYVSYTNEFERKALRLMERMPLSAVAKEMNVGWIVLEGMVKHYVNTILDSMDLSSVKRISLDETSYKKRHKYITVISDADRNVPIFMCKGKGSDSLKELSEWLKNHNGHPNNIKVICSDFSKAFLSGMKEHFPDAEIIYDKFHLVMMANRSIDHIRSKNQQNGERRKKLRFALLRNSDDLDDDEVKEILDITKDNVVIGKAYEMKESLVQLYDCPDYCTALDHAVQWLGWVEDEGEPQMKKTADTVLHHLDKILNWFRYPITNGFMEGFNGMIQLTKRIARGYRNVGNLIRMVFFKYGRASF